MAYDKKNGLSRVGHIRMFIPVTMSMKYMVFLSAQNHPNEME